MYSSDGELCGKVSNERRQWRRYGKSGHTGFGEGSVPNRWITCDARALFDDGFRILYLSTRTVWILSR